MQITIIGAGYVGLVTGSCFAEFGYKITCVDKDHQKIDLLNRGISPIYEPGLDSLLSQGSKSGRLCFTTKLEESVASADIIFLAVGTPTSEETGEADLSYVFSAAQEVVLNFYAKEQPLMISCDQIVLLLEQMVQIVRKKCFKDYIDLFILLKHL